jgi:uncharacterized protein YecE (DUF72 family)
MAGVWVGISGWNYAPWRGNFYPRGLPQRLELAYAARRFGALEVNGTFYSLQRPAYFQTWHDQTPAEFVFTLKGPRYLTHMLKLNGPRRPLANFFASGPLLLRDKLGPILWQFPPHFGFHAERFREFFELLPRDTEAAARLAREHDARLKGRAACETDARRPLRHAVEFRHASFLTPAFVRLLRDHGIALVVADVASKFPTAQDVTADFVYVRLHGSRRLYVSGYTPREIEAWARRIAAWRAGGEPEDARRIAEPAPSAPRGRDVFVFFDNTDVKLRAPVDARRMAERLGVGPDESKRTVLRALEVRTPGLKRVSAGRVRRAAPARH